MARDDPSMARRRAAWTSLLASLAGSLVAAQPVMAQCAMCRTSLIGSAEGQRLLGSFNAAILFLLSAPFLIVGIFAVLIFRPHMTVWLARVSCKQRLRDYLELTKPDVTLLVLISAGAAFYLGSSGRLDTLSLLHTLVGTALVSAGTAAFNQLIERDDDGKMRRTARRPLPAGRVRPPAVFVFAAVLSGAGVLYLALAVNLLASVLAAAGWASYLFVYTPLKKRTPLCTAIGTLPGAVPALIGWAAARNELSLQGWALYAILLAWQFPHLLSIAWIYRDDYARAGMRMVPVRDDGGTTLSWQIVLSSLTLVPVSLLPTAVGLAGLTYLLGALLLGAVLVRSAVRVATRRSNVEARRLLHASVLYVPLLFALLVLDKR